MCDSIKTLNIHGAYVQENGIIRHGDGTFLGRLDGIEFEDIKDIHPEPYLGCATTRELLEEITARVDNLDYRTVDA